MQITLAEGLVQLKRIRARIDKKIQKLDPISVTIGAKIPHLTVSPEQFSTDAKADLQSVQALIERARSIKAAIVVANATTEIKVGGKAMTIAEAIERKISIQHDRTLLLRLRTEQAESLRFLKDENAQVNVRLDTLLTETYRQDVEKIDRDKYASVAGPFLEANEAKILDPLGIDAVIREMDDEIDTFDEEVDIALTEANVRTTIDIPDA